MMSFSSVRLNKIKNFYRTIFLAIAFVALISILTLSLTACDEGDITNPLADKTIGDGSVALHGIIGDTNVHYTQDEYMNILNASKTTETLYAWKGDAAVSQIALISENAEIKNVNVEIGDFTDGNKSISAQNAEVSFVWETLAYTGLPDGNGPNDTPKGTKDKILVPDIISGASSADIPRNSVKVIWLQFNVPRATEAGTYKADVVVTGDNVANLTFQYTLEVADVSFPETPSFGIELWQYPYSVAEYYGVTPFSDKHLELLRKHMRLYKNIGADGITCSIVDEAWGGQTYSANEVRYPSMVKWIKQKDGTFTYDYSDMDTWIELNKELGLGNKIVLYSIASWSGQIRYYDVAKDKTVCMVPSFGSAMWTKMWKDFLEDIIVHLEDKNWFDETYMGVDERGFNVATLNLIDSVKGKNGKPLKTTGAFNEIENSEKVKLANRIDDISVGTKAVKANPEAYAELLAERTSMGKKTTIYTCTTHFPNNMTTSMPGESYWIAFYCLLENADGYMRWAYDAWVKYPLQDTTHWDYEAGDCFQVYPGDEDNNYTPRMSVRLAKLLEGVRDINKLKYLMSEMPSLKADVDKLLQEVNVNYSFETIKGAMHADGTTLKQLPLDMAKLKNGIRDITEKYLGAL